MPPKSLKSQLNQIRTWVRQGRTDAWIAHQLAVESEVVSAFKKDHALEIENGSSGAEVEAPARLDDEVDLRAHDEAQIADELEKAIAERDAARAKAAEQQEELEQNGEVSEDGPAKRRTRRGGRGRGRKRGTNFEGTFDHGEEGYGFWLDPAIADDPTYAEHWAGHRPILIEVTAGQIVISRAELDPGSAEPEELDSSE